MIFLNHGQHFFCNVVINHGFTIVIKTYEVNIDLSLNILYLCISEIFCYFVASYMNNKCSLKNVTYLIENWVEL